MKLKTKASILRTTFTFIFTALMCIGCFFSVPLPGGVPIVVQNLFAILGALILGGMQGSGAVGLFLILGAFGLPVFSGMKGGWDVFVGPTGGYLWGYFISAFVVGLIVGTPHASEKKFSLKMWIKIALSSLLGFVLIYVPGTLWFMNQLSGQGIHKTFSEILNTTVIPFIPGDFIKFVLSVPLSAVLRPVIAKILYPDDERELQEMIDEMKKRKEIQDNIKDKIFKKKK